MSEIEQGERHTIAPAASSEPAALPAPPATPRSSRLPPVPAAVLVLGSNGGNENPVATFYRAGVEETVWDAAAWASFYAKARGLA